MKNYSEQLEKSINAINSTTTKSIMFDAEYEDGRYVCADEAIKWKKLRNECQ